MDNNPVKPTFPHVWDSTMIASFRSCPIKFFRAYMEHWKPKGLSVHLHAGAAFATGLEAARRAFYVEGKSAQDSVALGMHALMEHYGDFECPVDSSKSAIRMAGALDFYFSAYPLGADPATPSQLGDRRGIEFSFAVPLPLEHPTTGDPLIYAGRADMVCDFAGARYILDDKTTSSLGASWARQWDLRSQFTGYCYAARKSGIDVSGVIVRGISILKTKYDTAQAITYRPEWQCERWLREVCKNIRAAEEMWRASDWGYNLDHACAEYGGCDFVNACSSEDSHLWIENYFERRAWDPLTRTETLIQDAP